MIQNSCVFEARFSAAHFYFQPQWSEKKNQSEFGRCFTPYGHGHNYRVEAEFLGDYDVELQKIFLKIVEEWDHRHLNFDIPDFQSQVPTTEALCQTLEQKIRKAISSPLLRLTLFEDFDIGAQISSELP